MRNLKAAWEIIKEFEGYYSKAYLDPVGIWTIGWGTIKYPNGRKVKKGDTCTKAEAQEWLEWEVFQVCEPALKKVKVELNDSQYCALLSFIYNCGAGAFSSSTMLKKLNLGDYKGASREFPRWNKAGGRVLNGLTRRRKSEMELFNEGVDNPIHDVEVPTEKPTYSEGSGPRITREEVEAWLVRKGADVTKVCLLGIRGYYLDSMGVKGKNDRGIYDDALIWFFPEGFMTFRANVDPSRVRKGKGTGSGKGMANLKVGRWSYKMGMHNGSVPHPAFRQAAEVIVVRDGNPNYEDSGWFGINIHRGGANSTSSLGCQTVPPAQWSAFKELGYAKLKELGQKTFDYVLMDETERRV